MKYLVVFILCFCFGLILGQGTRWLASLSEPICAGTKPNPMSICVRESTWTRICNPALPLVEQTPCLLMDAPEK